MTSPSASAVDRELLRRLFYPRSIALIGASERSPWSVLLHANLQRLGFDGRVYAINKTGASAHGYPGHVSCKDIPETVDAAFLFVPLEAVMEAFDDMIAAGIRSVVILTSGFAEAGEAGARLQQQLVTRAREAGVLFLGPNCLGFANLAIRASLTPTPTFPPILPGRISLVSQSGATNAEIVDMAHDMNIGLSLYIATGNEAMLDIASCVDFLVDDDNTQVIMVFAESIRDTATFSAAAMRARAKNKAIVILKVGTSVLTAQVAAAHTGSLVGDDKVFDAACQQLGVIRVHSLEDLVVTSGLLAHLLASGKPLDSDGVGIVSISGGACTLIADRAEVHGVNLPAFASETRTRLTAALPSASDPLNPFDITGVAIRDASLFERVLAAVGADASIGMVGCVFSMPWNDKWQHTPQLDAIGSALAALGKPGFLINQTLRPLTQKSRDIIAATGMPAVFGGLEDVVRALGHIRRWQTQSAATEAPAKTVAVSTAHPDGERAVLDFLSARDVPVIPSKRVGSREEAIAFARSLADPVAMKIASPDIAHKTDVGGVRLNVSGDSDVGAAYDGIIAAVKRAKPTAKIEGILISPMRSGGIELLVGTVCDPNWGPAIAVGLGGIWVEALADTQLHLLPITPAQVKTLLSRLRATRLLQGFRGTPAADLDALGEVIARIGDAALALGENLETLEINPLWVNGAQIEALDGLAVWKDRSAH